MEKKLFRDKLLKKRNGLSWLEVQGTSHEITQRILFLPAYQQAQTILFYLSTRNEIDTAPLIRTAWQQDKKVIVPVCQPNKNLSLSQLLSLEELGTGKWNIPEPKKEFLRPISPQEVDLVIVPGLAFDEEGYRLGYGAGYYDRFLTKLSPECIKLALAYEFQLISKVPREPHDIPVDMILTEQRVITIK